MSRRNNASVSLKLDSSPKQQTASNPKQTRPGKLDILSRLTQSNVLSFILGFVVSGLVYMSVLPPQSRPLESSNRENQQSKVGNGHHAAIVVPFRDRFDELEKFVPHLSRFLARKSISHEIWVVNQADQLRFNRAALINVGFLASASHSDYMIMHDVDLLPLNDKLDYSYPSENGPVHVSSPGLHPEYNYSSFIGGILSIRREHFVRTNGMSNRYWGWGKEDDEFWLRLKEANLSVQRPVLADFTTGTRFSFRDLHAETKRPRDKKRFHKQRQEALRRDDTGLNNLQYRVEAIRKLSFAGNGNDESYACNLLDVTLFCDRIDTHWCSMDYQFYE